MRRRLVAALATLCLTIVVPAAPVSAYEYQNGPARNCGPGFVQIGAYAYGDGNLYSNYGHELGQYNVPYWTLNYMFQSTTYLSVSATAAEAENYVPWAVGTDCTPV